ncbi:MAG: c-type cytochrome, partial [Gammaproteobacteria bacterium]
QGEKVYQSSCSSCHMPGGEGLPGTFPALKGSAIVNGDLDQQVKIVLEGKGMMPAFGQMLNAADLASVITYTRNALGNKVGDSIQPSEIQSMLK